MVETYFFQNTGLISIQLPQNICLGVSTDGDIIEVSPRTDNNTGLQFYFWQGFDIILGSNGTPVIDVVDMRRLSAFVPASGTTAIGPPANSGLYTEPLFLSNSPPNFPGTIDLDDPPQVIRPVPERYFLIFKGSLDLQNTGLFNFAVTAKDAIRMIVDNFYYYKRLG